MKKRLLAIILTVCLLVTIPCTTAFAGNGDIVFSASTKVDGVTIKSAEANGEVFLLLPPTADLTNLSLDFGDLNVVTLTGELGKVAANKTFDLTTVAGKDRNLRYVLSAETKTGKRYRLQILQGENIPTLYLTSDDPAENREWIDTSKDNKTTGSMSLISADGKKIHSAPLTQIKARGNTSFTNAEKKSYQIKLDKKADLLGIGEKEKTWVLLASYTDASFIHDKMFKDLAKELGMNYTPSLTWVNLYYDGEYRGIYTLGEKVSVGSSGVDIDDMEDAYDELNENYGDDETYAEAVNAFGQKYTYTENLADPEDITGGYLIEKNHKQFDEVNGFITRKEMGFNMKGPEYASKEAVKYISEYYQAFEDAVYATDKDGNYTGYNEATGKYYYEYCDLESLVQTYLIQALALNVDAYVSSFYFYKDAGEIMYAGPLWDMDSTCGTGWTSYVPYTYSDTNLRYLAEALSQIPSFKAAVERYYTYVFAPEIRQILKNNGTLDQYIAILEPNAKMNFSIWPYIRAGHPYKEDHLWKGNPNYTTVTNDLDNWLTNRMGLMDIFYKNTKQGTPEELMVTLSRSISDKFRNIMNFMN